MLQGVGSPFFSALAAGLRARGHKVRRVLFCGGDRYFWRGDGAIDFRGRREDLPAFYNRLFDRDGTEDLILFGDFRAIHRPAIDLAEAAGLGVHVFEEGYLRPDWVTLERGGVNGWSWLSCDPDWYLSEAAGPDPVPAERLVGAGMALRVRNDIEFHLSNYLQCWRYPRYRTHRPYTIALEYGGWLWRLAGLRRQQRRAAELSGRLIGEGQPYYVFPLQLDSDVQLRVHSPFHRMPAALEPVIASFAAHAPKDATLLVKNHPLHNGLLNYRARIADAARRHGVARRVMFIDGGVLEPMIEASLGVVTVNSTVGQSALELGKPVVVLGKAIYDIAGLTHQGKLDDFWRDLPLPDSALLAAFRAVILQATQVNGNFYTHDGIAHAVANSVVRLERTNPRFATPPPAPRRACPLPDRLEL